jgi:hypothetical protein
LAKIGPVIEGRFHAAFLQCAQECAHAVVMVGLGRFVEPIAFQGVSGKAAVCQTPISISAIVVLPNKFKRFNNFLNRATWLAVGSRSPVLGADRDNFRDIRA